MTAEPATGRHAAGQIIEYTSPGLPGYATGQVVRYAGEAEQDNPADLLVYIRARSGAKPLRVRESQLRHYQPATPALTRCGACGTAIEEQDTGLWEAGGDTADQRRHCTESNDHLHRPGYGGTALQPGRRRHRQPRSREGARRAKRDAAMSPGLEYQGYAKFADGTVVSLQCYDGRCAACPDQSGEGPGGRREETGPLDGDYCECPACDHGPAALRERVLAELAVRAGLEAELARLDPGN